MRTGASTISNEKPRVLKWLENTLLFLVLALTALRATYIEGPHPNGQDIVFLSSEIVSLLLSTFLLGCCVLWLAASILLNQFRWRKTQLGLWVTLFFIAGIVSFFAASDKRAAVTDWVVLMSPMVVAMFLVQWLGSQRKIRLAVLLMIAIGIAATVQCIDQWTDSNDTMIRQYEQNPTEQLSRQGIEPDSLQHWMYEHRLYSKDIRGFLMTSNSTASFFLLAIFASLGLCVEAFRERKHSETLAALVCYSLAFVMVFAGLIMTQSKGGIGAMIIGAILFVSLGLFGKRFWKYRAAVGILLLLAIVAVGGLIIGYGCQHGRLGGGNSMLVRWQYWQSTAAMIGEHFWTGVGGGNFADYYTHYKHAAASETIQNPHCWILSLLSQYGPLGLLAFCGAVLGAFWKSLRGRFTGSETVLFPDRSSGKMRWWLMLLITAFFLLFARPKLMGFIEGAESLWEMSAAYVVLYLVPAGVFGMAFALLCTVAGGDVSVGKRNDHLATAIFCGLVAVLIHNLIDFAIFEPGIWGTFWLFVTILVATVHNQSSQPEKIISLGSGSRLFAMFGLAGMVIVYCAMVIIPPVKARVLFNGSRNTASFEEFEEKIRNALAADVLSSDVAYDVVGMLMGAYSSQNPLGQDSSLLEKMSMYAEIAQQRNPVSFKSWRLESDIYLLLAERTKDDEQIDFLQKAYDALLEARDRYPGSDKIHYGLGMVAEELGYWEKALSHFRTAVDIEQLYQAQFKVMYPDREPVVSRLGNTAYTIAKAKIEELQKKLQ